MTFKGAGRWAGVLAAAAVMAVVVVACGGDDSGGGGGGGGGKSIRGQTITYWASNQGATIDDDKQVLSKAIARFTQQTGVKVNFKVIPWPDLFNNITTATTSGKGPDVLNIGNTWSASLQATGAFMPFDGDALNAVGGQDKFVKSSCAASGAPGQDADVGPALRPLLRALLQHEAVRRGRDRRAAEDVVGVPRRREEADQARQGPVGRRRSRARSYHRERALGVHPRPPERRRAVRRQQADVRHARRSSRASRTT